MINWKCITRKIHLSHVDKSGKFLKSKPSLLKAFPVKFLNSALLSGGHNKDSATVLLLSKILLYSFCLHYWV